jgi:hypothetical protein
MVLFYDEVLFGHDPRLRGRLKGEITEPWIAIEPKGIDRYHVRNTALRVYTSNERASMPIDLDDRRVFALEVSNIHAKDLDYFSKLRAAIGGEELAAFVAEALAADLSAFETTRREPPKTKARAELAAATAKREHEYLYLLLDRGRPLIRPYDWNARRYPRMSPEPQDPWRDGQITVKRYAIYEDYVAWMRERARIRKRAWSIRSTSVRCFASCCLHRCTIVALPTTRLVNRLRKPEMMDDDVEEIVRVVDAYLSGRLCAADWRLWLRRREEMEQAAAPPPSHCRSRTWTTSSNASDGES